MQSTAGKTGWTKKYQHWLTLASAAINSLQFNSQALWPAVTTVLGLLDSNCYSSHQGQPPAPQVNKTKEAKRPPPFHQGLSLQIQGRMRGSLGKFTAGWQRITRSFPASSPFLLRREKKKKKSNLCRFSKPSAKQGLQPHRPRKRYHSRNHRCILSISGGGESPCKPATINQETTDNQATNSPQHPQKYTAQTPSCCWAAISVH